MQSIVIRIGFPDSYKDIEVIETIIGCINDMDTDLANAIQLEVMI